jgi:hypothetical protein
VQVRLRIIALGLLVWINAALAAEQPGTELPFFKPQDYERLEGSGLPQKFGEKVVRDPGADVPSTVPAVVLALTKPYASAVVHLRTILVETIGERDVVEAEVDDLGLWNEYVGATPDQFDQERLAAAKGTLSGQAIKASAYTQTTITSKKYNKALLGSEYAQTIFRVIDGADVFGKPWTLVVLSRTDKEFGFGFMHGTIIPMAGFVRRNLVTDTELGLLIRLAGPPDKFRVVLAPFFETSLHANAEVLARAKHQLGGNSAN